MRRLIFDKLKKLIGGNKGLIGKLLSIRPRQTTRITGGKRGDKYEITFADGHKAYSNVLSGTRKFFIQIVCQGSDDDSNLIRGKKYIIPITNIRYIQINEIEVVD